MSTTSILLFFKEFVDWYEFSKIVNVDVAFSLTPNAVISRICLCESAGFSSLQTFCWEMNWDPEPEGSLVNRTAFWPEPVGWSLLQAK